MKINYKKLLMLGTGIVATIGGALADGINSTNATSTDITGHLGVFSDIGGFILVYSKYIALLVAVITLFVLWSKGNIAKWSHKIETRVHVIDWKKSYFEDCFWVILALIVLFKILIPMVNVYLPNTTTTLGI